jgi:hypothetical protein
MQLPKAPTSGAFVSFKNEGDTSDWGIVTDINGNGTTFNGDPCPEVVLNVNGAVVTVTCSQAQLWSKTVAVVESGELAIGRAAKFTMSKIERRNGGKTLKHFEIETKDADAAMVSASASSATDEPF